MKKIYIIGIPGSGKSTLAKELSLSLKISHFDLDDIFWIEKYTKERTASACLFELKKILQKNKSWIIEGVYGWSKSAIDSATLIIWLDTSINIATLRVIKRWIGRKDKETIRQLCELIKCIRAYKKIAIGKNYTVHEEYEQLVSENRNNLVKIENGKQLNELLKKIQP